VFQTFDQNIFNSEKPSFLISIFVKTAKLNNLYLLLKTELEMIKTIGRWRWNRLDVCLPF
tara:strand:- start:328 stop:507 length:180 start_codon:yes stop_codon:yes gene_type:complete